MTWTYGGAPSTSSSDAFRLLIGDTDTTDQIFSDAEVTYFLAQNSSVTRAAAIGCRAAAAKYARQITYSLGDLSEQLAQKVRHFSDLAVLLDAAAKKGSFVASTVTLGSDNLGKVKDVATYPERYVHGDESMPEWDIDEDVS